MVLQYDIVIDKLIIKVSTGISELCTVCIRYKLVSTMR